MPIALVIEDDRDTRRMFAEALQTLNFEVFGVGSASEALQILAARVPDIVFLDMGLPGVSGTEVLSYLKHEPQFAKTRTVVITANSEAQHKVDELGADLFLLKPVSIPDMLTLVRRLIPSQ